MAAAIKAAAGEVRAEGHSLAQRFKDTAGAAVPKSNVDVEGC